MTDTFSEWKCKTCGAKFAPRHDGTVNACLSCGSKDLTRFIEIHDEAIIRTYEFVSGKAKDHSRPSKQKVRKEFRSGRRPEGSGTGRLVDEHRMIDHDNDRYEEKVVDVDSGEVLRDISEPLSKHRGGTEKRAKK